MIRILLFILIVIVLIIIFHPLQNKKNILKDIQSLKTQTINMLNKVLNTDTSRLIDFHIPDLHCDGLIDRILSPDELIDLYGKNPSLYAKLSECGYTRTVGLIHGYALWSSLSKTKDFKSFKYFTDCIVGIDWKDVTLFKDFHTQQSKLAKCIV